MSQARPEQMILVGRRTVALPEDVSIVEWALERDAVQNLRIKSVLGSIRMLEEILDSNYAILHCSPVRLLEIRRRVEEIADSIRHQLGPLLRKPSVLPNLERARKSSLAALKVLSHTTLAQLERHPADANDDRQLALRKLLCVSIGELHCFLQDTFGAIMEADPRSRFDRDYFLSRRFPRDVEEAEWLYEGVGNLSDFVGELVRESKAIVVPLVGRLRNEELLPSPSAWMAIERFGDRIEALATKLREVLALRGIRFDEMEVLDVYARDFPEKLRQLSGLYEAASAIGDGIKASTPEGRSEREQSVTDLLHVHSVSCGHLASLSQAIHGMILDLDAFLPIWQRNIGERRALLLYGDSRGASLPAGLVQDGPERHAASA